MIYFTIFLPIGELIFFYFSIFTNLTKQTMHTVVTFGNFKNKNHVITRRKKSTGF